MIIVIICSILQGGIKLIPYYISFLYLSMLEKLPDLKNMIIPLVIGLLSVFIGFLIEKLICTTVNVIERDYRTKIIETIIYKFFGTFSNIDKDELIHMFTEDFAMVDVFIEDILPTVIRNGVSMGICIILLFNISMPVTVVILLISLGSYFFLRLILKKAIKLSNEYRDERTKSKSFIIRWVGNISEVKINNLAQHIIRIQVGIWNDLLKVFRKKELFQSFVTIQNAVDSFVLEVVVVYFLGGIYVIKGDVSLPLLLLYSYYYSFFLGNLSSFRSKYSEFTASVWISINRINTMVDSFGIQSYLKIERTQESDLTLEIENVKHFNGNKKIFELLSLKVEPNECIGITGESGIGKSTLFDLILGVTKPYSGSILLQGENKLYNVSPAFFSTVTQESTMVKGTILDNFRLLDSDIDMDVLEKLCIELYLIDEQQNFQEWLKYTIDEYGTGLSGGEKQRIALIRALLTPSKILILDEPTASLDLVTEKAVKEVLKQYKSDKMIILFTHRTPLLELCDNIYKIEGCKLNLKEGREM